MSAELTELAAQLERTARERATARVNAAIEPLIAPIVQDLRRALHRVVGSEADVLVVGLVNTLRLSLVEQAGEIAQRHALKDIVERLTAEAQA